MDGECPDIPLISCMNNERVWDRVLDAALVAKTGALVALGAILRRGKRSNAYSMMASFGCIGQSAL
jgi:hypothetical protein